MANLLRKIIGDKKEWRGMEARAAALPNDYRIVYDGIKRYMWKFTAGNGMDVVAILNDLLGLFETGAADGKRALDGVGTGVPQKLVAERGHVLARDREDQSDRPVRRRGRDPHRSGEPRPRCQATGGGQPRRGRRQPAAAVRPERRGRQAGGHVSGGMARRLDIAMSLVGTPAVIFLDEPTTGLDPEGRLEVWRTIKKLAGEGTTILLTTQHLDEAEQLADRIAILHDGRIIVSGTLAELKQLFPPAKIEYVERQPTLEEIFLAIVGKKSAEVDR